MLRRLRRPLHLARLTKCNLKLTQAAHPPCSRPRSEAHASHRRNRQLERALSIYRYWEEARRRTHRPSKFHLGNLACAAIQARGERPRRATP